MRLQRCDRRHSIPDGWRPGAERTDRRRKSTRRRMPAGKCTAGEQMAFIDGIGMLYVGSR